MKFMFPLLMTFSLVTFMSCTNQSDSEAKQSPTENTAINKEQYLQKGKTIATTTFATLSAELGQALQAGGVATAIEKCNLVAMPLVDSLSTLYKAQIRRTSLKARNPANQPSQAELMILKAYENQVAQQVDLKPLVVENEDQSISFYAPIKIQELCLNCHGEIGEELKPEDNVLIKSLYPNDKATGYQLNDLRGMWSITFRE